MKKITALLLVDYTIEDEDTFDITIVPKGTILYECYDGGGFSTSGDGLKDGEKKPKYEMTIGCSFVYKNPKIFKV